MRRLLPLSLLVLLSACPPPCKQVCRKVLFSCELDSERVALDECVESCSRQEAIYRVWDDQELLDLELDHRRCVMDASCDEIAAGACYEGYEDLFAIDPDKELDTGTSTPER